ncbi:hypothetical protein K474DRAFT_1586300 [Panus rudis PR-1116 ss-1]|nr:hypothetical protein K474DRAFT_1586300 [Panus rudis PR-1116 ss-1]
MPTEPSQGTDALPILTPKEQVTPSRGNSPRPQAKQLTDPTPTTHLKLGKRIKKRIVVCCDGTWQDGLTARRRWNYTNILRLARAIQHVDDRYDPPVPQVVYYQSGVGTESFAPVQWLDGALGASLADKIQDAYAFLAHNYQPGDEIFLFGFSRGAYTARMVAALIGEIGVLDRMDMDHFADIFIAYQKRGKAKDVEEIKKLDDILQPWTQHTSPGKIRADYDQDHFLIHCLGVFDTVGSVGLPEELSLRSDRVKTIFGFSDKYLGPHVARAYHALALNENRKDFDCAKFEQTEEGARKKQVLKQCWFAGSHSDIGGGYEEHDLSDLTLFWMAANIGDILALNITYLASLPEPVAPWGEQSPHDSATGIFALADTIHRSLPTADDNRTHEMIHPSVLKQHELNHTLEAHIKQNPHLMTTLLPLEEEVKANWKPSFEKSKAYDDHKKSQKDSKKDKKDENLVNVAKSKLEGTKAQSKDIQQKITHTRTMYTESGEPVYEDNWFGKMIEESSVGQFIQEIMGARSTSN